MTTIIPYTKHRDQIGAGQGATWVPQAEVALTLRLIVLAIQTLREFRAQNSICMYELRQQH